MNINEFLSKYHYNNLIVMKKIIYYSLIQALLVLFPLTLSATNNSVEDMKKNPPRYIEVSDWGLYVASRVAIIHHITIENKSSVTYKDLKIRVNYYSTNPTNYGTKISQQVAVLKITLQPKSKKTYIKGGKPIGAGSQQMLAKNLEVLSATAETN